MPRIPNLPRSAANSRTGTSPASNHSAMCGRNRCSPNRRMVSRNSLSSGVSRASRSSRSSMGAVALMIHVYTPENRDSQECRDQNGSTFHAGFRSLTLGPGVGADPVQNQIGDRLWLLVEQPVRCAFENLEAVVGDDVVGAQPGALLFQRDVVVAPDIERRH